MRRLTRVIMALSVAAGLSTLGAWSSAAQDPARDDALDRLLDKVQDKGSDKEKAPNKSEKKADEPQDKALDDLLQKLGKTDDAPDTTGRSKATPGGDDAPKPKAKSAPTEKLEPEKKQLDEHLEDLLGRKRRKQDQEGDSKQKSDPNDGPLAQAIKKMRDVEQRLGEQDTGDGTRKKQEEIVKDLDQMIKLAKQMGKGQGRGRQRGQRPGDQQGQEQQTDDPRQGTGPTKSKTPSGRQSLADNKDVWGHLPPEIRAEMENMFKEEALPARRELIDRYYLSVTRKSTTDQNR